MLTLPVASVHQRSIDPLVCPPTQRITAPVRWTTQILPFIMSAFSMGPQSGKLEPTDTPSLNVNLTWTVHPRYPQTERMELDESEPICETMLVHSVVDFYRYSLLHTWGECVLAWSLPLTTFSLGCGNFHLQEIDILLTPSENWICIGQNYVRRAICTLCLE